MITSKLLHIMSPKTVLSVLISFTTQQTNHFTDIGSLDNAHIDIGLKEGYLDFPLKPVHR